MGVYAMSETLKAQLCRQLEFIKLSCKNFDEGHLAEAVRIATAIRVLIHQTTRSESLLKQLGVRETIGLMTSVDTTPITSAVTIWDGLSVLPPMPQSAFPAFLRSMKLTKIPLPDWWQQIVMAENRLRVTRRQIVLMAANKDGGAHVDEDLNDTEQLLKRGMWRQATYTPSGIVEEALSNQHMIGLRRFGFEILHSEELMALAGMSVGD